MNMDIDLLREHPLNAKLYGKCDLEQVGAEFEGLRDSIKEHGVISPLLITEDNVIVSGHRCWFFAKLLGKKEVPVTVLETTDPLKIESMMIHCNRNREKTTEQKARECKHLAGIERELAKRRQRAAAAKTNKALGRKAEETLPAHLPEASTGEANTLAAAQVGMSRHTAEKAMGVVDIIDQREEAGDIEGAETLREKLNRSVSAAHEEIKPAKPKKAKPASAEPVEDSYRLNEHETKQLHMLNEIWHASSEYVHAAFLQGIEKP